MTEDVASTHTEGTYKDEETDIDSQKGAMLSRLAVNNNRLRNLNSLGSRCVEYSDDIFRSDAV
jgi:hypothetical protein